MDFVSVVIPTYNRKDLLSRCIKSIVGQGYASAKYEIIVIDDGSNDGTSNLLKDMSERLSNLKFIIQSNKGHALARKKGFEMAAGSIIVSLDDDCIPLKGWLENIVEAFNLYPRISIICGRIINPIQNKIAWAQHFIDYSLWIGRKKKFNIKIVPAGNTAYRLKDLQSFVYREDGKMFGYRDIMFNYSLIKKGYKAMYSPNIAVEHYRWKTDPMLAEDLDLFRLGQIRHGNGLRKKGYLVYNQWGEALLRLPAVVYIIIKFVFVGFRALKSSLFGKFIYSASLVFRGIYWQSFAFKGIDD